MPFELTLNQNLVAMEYAVRGPIPRRAGQLARKGRQIVFCNIGNPQALGQKPISYYREVLSLVEDPSRIERERKRQEIASEVIDAADTVLRGLASGMGAYTASPGLPFVQKAIAGYIDERDGVTSDAGVSSDPDMVFLTNGASEGAKHILDLLIADPNDGIMIPIPQYPLYSATIKRCGGVQVGYYPDEEAGWTLDRGILDRAIEQAKRDGVRVKAIVVINPGNPTGAILDRGSIEQLIDFAAENRLAIIADEVYQANLYGGRFFSFASVLDDRDVPLFSLHSVSKGFYGECGQRGGYLEVRNPPSTVAGQPSFIDTLTKLTSVSLCSNTSGQILTYLMVTPPESGTPTRERFDAERERILDDLAVKADMIRKAFAQMKGVQCFGKTGAMYLFPRLDQLPEGTGDFDYCMALLEETGLCTVDGGGFGQAPGTRHLRIAFLPDVDRLTEVLPRWIEFHNRYVGAGG